MIRGNISILLMLLIVGSLFGGELGKVRYEFFPTGGLSLADDNWRRKGTPTTSYLTEFSIPQNSGNYYGGRLTAIVTIPETGDYTFYVSADDIGELKLSTDCSEENLETIANTASWTQYMNFTRFPSQTSATYSFNAGDQILLVARFVEFGGGDHLSIAWSKDNGTTIDIIPGSVCTAPNTGAPAEIQAISGPDGVSLNWSRSLLTEPVNSWNIFKDGVEIATNVTETTYQDENNEHGVTYIYTIKAQGPEILSTESSPVSVTYSAHPQIYKGFVLQEIFNRNGASIETFDWTQRPKHVKYLTQFSTEKGVDDHFVSRLTTTITVPATGEYTFYIAADDHGRLDVSTDGTLAGLQTVAYTSSWTNYQQFDMYPSQTSQSIHLQKGAKILVVAYQLDYQGSDHLSVAWSFNSDQTIEPIPNDIMAIPHPDYPKIQVVPTSYTSPACIEGQFFYASGSTSFTVGTGVTQTPTFTGNSWFANIPLQQGAPTALKVNEYNGDYDLNIEMFNGTIEWKVTDLTEISNLTIRQGDSLLLTKSGEGEELKIDFDYFSDENFDEDFVGSPGEIVKMQFNIPGTYSVKAIIDGLQESSLTLRVVQVSLPAETACEVDYEREQIISVEGITASSLYYTSYSYDLSYSYKLDDDRGSIVNMKPLAPGKHPYWVRINGQYGPIVAANIMDAFEFGTQATKLILPTQVYEDGAMLLETNMEIFPHVGNLDVTLDIYKSGFTFHDSSIQLNFNTNQMFQNQNGEYIYPYGLISPPNYSGGACHTHIVYQNGIRVSK
ncbi:MAG: PA14 domain-containing protein [Lentisphaeria bacterium]|nr:PA14 domain-containing protein [Lentisphaeria bacterium]